MVKTARLKHMVRAARRGPHTLQKVTTKDIKARGYQDRSSYLNYFSDVLNVPDLVPKMDKDFMMDLCSKLEDLVKDDNLTMEELTKLAP